MSFTFTHEQKQAAFWIALWVAFFVLLFNLGPVLTPFIAAAILAYALNPAVDWFATRRPLPGKRIPRPLAVLIVMTLFILALLALMLIVIPVMQKEIPLLQAKLPVILDKANAALTPYLTRFGIETRFDSASLRAMATQYMDESGKEIWRAVLDSARVGGSVVLGWLSTLFVVPMVLFYFLLDWHGILQRLARAIPRRWEPRAVAMAQEADGLLAQYLRGQLLVMLALAAFYSIGLLLIGLDVALPVGIFSGLLGFVPYLGFGVGIVLALIAALLQFPGWYGVLAVAAVYGIGQFVESFFLTPRLVGERIGMNPLAVIFALMAFGQLFGFTGVLLALPASAVLMVGFRHLRAHYLASRFYNA
ncbi:MAG TPA: AI-2E family transporter [Burkholderiaceae bacterium]